MQEIVKGSELIFEGKVIARDSVLSSEGNKIHTHVTFEISEIVKGEYSEKSIQLRFLGGTVGELTFEISDLHIPNLGREGYLLRGVFTPLPGEPDLWMGSGALPDPEGL